MSHSVDKWQNSQIHIITTLGPTHDSNSSSSYLFSDNNIITTISQKNHTIGGLPEKPYSSPTGRQSKKK